MGPNVIDLKEDGKEDTCQERLKAWAHEGDWKKSLLNGKLTQRGARIYNKALV